MTPPAPVPPPNESAVESLARVFCPCGNTGHAPQVRQECDYATRSAQLILASGWLADIVAAAKAEERERVAAAIEADYVPFPLDGMYAGVWKMARDNAAAVARSAPSTTDQQTSEGGER